MKKFTLTLLGFCLAGLVSTQAQEKAAPPATGLARTALTGRPAIHAPRCATTEALTVARQRNPQGFEQMMTARRAQAASNLMTSRTSTLSGPVTIPVVVHVVLFNPYVITDEQVDALIDRLNKDYSGLNADSTNGSAFYGVRGHSQIRFARARRTPAGAATNGIERKVGNVGIEMDTYQPVKHASEGGLDPWDIEKYYNIWVADGGGSLLGIAPAIGKGEATEVASSTIGIDGVVIDWTVFSNGCFSDPSFNKGRTAVHEIGHNFGLYHTFHYDPTQGAAACTTGADFLDAESPLPNTLYGPANDDTPNQSSSTSGCPTGNSASNCGGGVQKMYQNYMDYTNDACYSMFTKKQVARMEFILENYRSGYLTSQGHLPPASVPGLDVAPVSVVNPGGAEFNNTTCTLTPYAIPLCSGNITPRIEIKNNGATTINSITVSVQVNAATPVTTTVNGLNLASGYTTFVTLNPVALVNGTNTIKYTTSAPNGGADAVTSNDLFTQTITIAAPVAAPITEGFETSFPSANFSVLNPDSDTTWRRNSPGRTGTYSIFMNNWDAAYDTYDEFRFTPMNLTPGADSLVISFDQAYRYYISSTTGDEYTDTLSVYVTNNCGTSYSTVFHKGGADLSVAGGSSSRFTNPTAAQWRNERVALSGALLAPGRVIVSFENYAGFGNNLFIDNINITSTCKTTTFSAQPQPVTVCAGQAANFSVSASGNASLTYQWKKGGADIPGATSATYAIASTTVSDAANYTVAITNACGVTTVSNPAALTVNTGGICSGSAVSNVNPDVAGVVLMPNTVRNTTTLRVNAVRAMKIDWTIIDAEGRIVKRFAQAVTAGQNDIKVNVQDLASGAYQLVGNSSKGKTNTLKFVRL